MVSYLAELVPRLRRERLEIQKVEVVKSEPPVIEFDGYLYLGDVIWGIGGQVSSRQADGILVISMLRLHALQPADAAITARLIGKLPASLIVRAVVAKLDDENELDSWADALGVPAAPSSRVRARKRRAARSLRDGAPPRGRRGTPREFYDTLADEAVGLAAQGLPVI